MYEPSGGVDVMKGELVWFLKPWLVMADFWSFETVLCHDHHEWGVLFVFIYLRRLYVSHFDVAACGDGRNV
jgi:hypothetical protein